MNTNAESNSEEPKPRSETAHQTALSEIIAHILTTPSDDSSSKSNEAINALQTDLTKEQDARRNERFYWICILVFVFDLFAFRDMQTWSAPIAIAIIQFLFLISLGRFLGDDKLWTLTEMAIRKWDGTFGRKR